MDRAADHQRRDEPVQNAGAHVLGCYLGLADDGRAAFGGLVVVEHFIVGCHGELPQTGKDWSGIRSTGPARSGMLSNVTWASIFSRACDRTWRSPLRNHIAISNATAQIVARPAITPTSSIGL